MPEISRFFGVVITMYYREHQPPHFHARYAGRSAIIGIEPVERLAGGLPPPALSLVFTWARLHRDELLANWERGRRQADFTPIAPLP